jgi:integrase
VELVGRLVNPTITRHKVESFTKVKAFLDSIQRNSKQSKKVYQTGITHFQDFLYEKYTSYSTETILDLLNRNEINVYELLDNFVSFLMALKLSANSIQLYMAAIRSYLAYYDIDVIPSKFKRRVKMPKSYREDEEPIDAKDIRNILLHCNNRRLKSYLLILASDGMRAVEELAIRLKDIDFSVSPTKVHIRKEFAKTKVSRDIYISDEATHYLKQWIEWKYNNEERPRIPNPDDTIFSVYRTENESNPNNLYLKILYEFEKLLSSAGLDQRKDEGIQKRRKITLHSFRRYVKSVISNQVNQDYSEWFLGHSKSPYYSIKEIERREIYSTKIMRYLTFLDYTTLEASGKNIEAKLSEREREIQMLRQRDTDNTDAIASLSDKMQELMVKVQELEKLGR